MSTDLKISDSVMHSLSPQVQSHKLTHARKEDFEKIQKAASDFEGVFLDQVVKSMRATVESSDVFGDSDKVKFFQTMLDTEFAKLSAVKNKIGIANAIVKQVTQKWAAEDELKALKDVKE